MNKSEGEQQDFFTPLIEGRDFYWENGLMVLTEAYLLRRGKCCGSGCRHCPYRKRKSRAPRQQA